MTLGFDAKRLFFNFTGLGNYSRDLVRNLNAFFPEHSLHLYSPKINDTDRTREFLYSLTYQVHRTKNPLKSYWRTFGMGKDLVRDQIDIYHGLSHELPFNFPKEVKSVVTIHDLIFEKFPQQYAWADRQIYRKKFTHSCEIADRVVAISEATKKDLIEIYQVPEEKISVIYQSCAEIFYEKADEETQEKTRIKYKLPKDYLLYVGSIIERKNLLNIVKAIHLIPPDQQMPLVVVGEGKKYADKVKNYIHQNGLENLIHFLAQIDFADLPAIYQMATLFIYPSLYEGFGIPVIEALASGTPVITSSVSSLPEAGGPDSHYVDPNSIEELKKALEDLPANQAHLTSMYKKGEDYVKKFDREKVTREMVELYESLL